MGPELRKHPGSSSKWHRLMIFCFIMASWTVLSSPPSRLLTAVVSSEHSVFLVSLDKPRQVVPRFRYPELIPQNIVPFLPYQELRLALALYLPSALVKC